MKGYPQLFTSGLHERVVVLLIRETSRGVTVVFITAMKQRLFALFVLCTVSLAGTGLPYQYATALSRTDALGLRVSVRPAVRVAPPVTTPPAPTPTPEPTPTPDPTPIPEPTPEPEPTPDPTPEPDPVPDPQPAARGMISFDIDDGWDSGYEKGLPIFDAADIKVTYYVSTMYLQFPGFVTPDQLQNVSARGHEIGSHARNHDDLSGLPEAQMKSDINGGKQDLADLGFTPSMFAYPYGGSNAQVQQAVKDAGFSGARGANGGYNDSTTDTFMLYAWNLNSSMTLEAAKAIIDQAAAENKWVIFVMHKVDETGTDATNVKSEMLQELIEYVKEKNIDVVTNSEGLARVSEL